jgi:rhamnose transport system permease protein
VPSPSPAAGRLGASRLRALGLLIPIVLLLVVPWFTNRGFYRFEVFQGMVMDNLSVLVAAAGMTLVILAAEIDISIAAQLAVCGVAAGSLSRAGLPIAAVIVLTLTAGTLLGLLNGALVAYFGISSIVATLAMNVLLANGLLWLTRGMWVQNLRSDFQWLGLAPPTGQAVFLAVALAVVLLFGLLLSRTTFGRHFYAVGCSHEAALRLKIDPRRVVLWAFTLLGTLMGLAAIIHYCRFPSIETGGGAGMEMKVIAAVVVGGTAITGGRGSLLGSVLGVILLALVGSVLTFTPLGSTAERAVQGLIILLAVVADKLLKREEAADA